MCTININIHGGNNQILPNATHSIQNIYIGSDATDRSVTPDTPSKVDEEKKKLSLYINKVRIQEFIDKLSVCKKATDIGKAVATLCEGEFPLSKEQAVKADFINSILPFAKGVTDGQGVDNVRVHINNALRELDRQIKQNNKNK